MANLKGKTTIATALLIILAMGISLFAFPGNNQTSAATTSYPYIGALPNPAGVGQEVLLHVGVLTQLNDASQGWEGLSVTIKRPDGQTDTISNIKTDATGGTGRTYTPTMEGNYTLVTHFPAQNATDYWGTPIPYAAADSDPLTLVVLAEPVPVYPGHSLPTEYWTRPIYGQNNDLWAAIGGNWLGLQASTFANTGQYNSHGDYAPYTTAPNSPHIMWTKQIAFGGVMGGEFGTSQQSNFWSTSQYQPKFAP